MEDHDSNTVIRIKQLKTCFVHWTVQVNTVDPLKITDEFSNILATPVIATDVGAKIVMHRDLWVGQFNTIHTQ